MNVLHFRMAVATILCCYTKPLAVLVLWLLRLRHLTFRCSTEAFAHLARVYSLAVNSEQQRVPLSSLLPCSRRSIETENRYCLIPFCANDENSCGRSSSSPASTSANAWSFEFRNCGPCSWSKVSHISSSTLVSDLNTLVRLNPSAATRAGSNTNAAVHCLLSSSVFNFL